MGYEMLYVYFALMIVSVALQMSAAPKTTRTTPEAGKLDTPTAEEGSSIPVVFGTVLIKKSNVVWYGDALTTEIKTNSGGGGKK